MNNFIILFSLCLLISSIGFYKYVYFISLGYGFSIATLGIVLLLLYPHIEMTYVLLCILLVIYGIRLGGYLLVREMKSASYRKTMKKEINDGKSMSFFVKVCIWISCAFLYVCQISPIYIRLMSNTKADTLTTIGLEIMIFGILFESIADYEKSKAKKKYPDRFCDRGLYKIVRCPNYLGEILFWSGVLLSGITAFTSIIHWIAGLFGYVCIVYIMFGGARRLEIRQNKNYGQDLKYQIYSKQIPILIPFIPLYSVEKYKWLVG